MKMRYWILIVVALLIMCIGLYIGTYIYSLKQVGIKDVEMNLAEISLEGAAVKGDIIVENKGLIGVTIEEVRVDVRINSDRLGGAVIDGEKIPAGGEARFPVEVGIDWVPTVQLALDLLQSEKKYIIVEGSVTLPMNTLRFEKKIDLTEYLLQFTKTTIEKIPGARKALEKVQEQMGKMFG